MTLLAISTHNVEVYAVAAGAVWVAITAIVAAYGYNKGFPFFPLFVAGLFLGPIGWGLVLLGVVLAAGPGPPPTR